MWSTSEIERGLSLLMGICCIMPHLDSITDYNGLYCLLCRIEALTSRVDTALQRGSTKKVVEICQKFCAAVVQFDINKTSHGYRWRGINIKGQ